MRGMHACHGTESPFNADFLKALKNVRETACTVGKAQTIFHLKGVLH